MERENQNHQKRKITDPKGDALLHGNHARIDPARDVVSEYKFSSVVQQDAVDTRANIPIASEETVELAKQAVDENHK